MTQPWSFAEAKNAARNTSLEQRDAETVFVERVENHARAEAAYRVELAKEILVLRGDGQPVTIIGDLARGNERISTLKLERDIAKGMLDAATQRVWRQNADRRDVQRLIDWSLQVSTGRAAD